MADHNWSEYKPSKTVWVWSCIGCILGTLILGFTWGGWVTGGTAAEMAAAAADDARTEIAATVCVNKFVNSSGATAEFAALKEASSWERDGIIEEGGWSTINGFDGDLSGVADACAEKLAGMEALPASATTQAAVPADDI